LELPAQASLCVASRHAANKVWYQFVRVAHFLAQLNNGVLLVLSAFPAPAARNLYEPEEAFAAFSSDCVCHWYVKNGLRLASNGIIGRQDRQLRNE
jgi:hypothetical protein